MSEDRRGIKVTVTREDLVRIIQLEQDDLEQNINLLSRSGRKSFEYKIALSKIIDLSRGIAKTFVDFVISPDETIKSIENILNKKEDKKEGENG